MNRLVASESSSGLPRYRPLPLYRPLLCWLLCCLATTGCSNDQQDQALLHVACAASLQTPVTKLARRFESTHDVKIDLQFGGTSMLVNQVKLAGNVDLLITADQLSTDQMMNSGLASACHSIAVQIPVIVTSKESAGLVSELSDLLREDLRIGLGDAKATSIGKATRRALGKSADPLYNNAVVTRTSVTALATDLQVGSIDAAIVWDSTAKQFHLPVIEDRNLALTTEVASACPLAAAQHPLSASQFAIYLSESDEAASVFEECEFVSANPDFVRHRDLP